MKRPNDKRLKDIEWHNNGWSDDGEDTVLWSTAANIIVLNSIERTKIKKNSSLCFCFIYTVLAYFVFTQLNNTARDSKMEEVRLEVFRTHKTSSSNKAAQRH